jgi:hypothetical protein
MAAKGSINEPHVVGQINKNMRAVYASHPEGQGFFSK